MDEAKMKKVIVDATVDGFRFWLENDGELAELPLNLQGRIGVSICQVTRRYVTSNQVKPNHPVKSSTNRLLKKRSRIRKHARTLMTRADADLVRGKLRGIKNGSTEYYKARDETARETGFSRRQIGSAMTGLERAALRKKRKKSKKPPK